MTRSELNQGLRRASVALAAAGLMACGHAAEKAAACSSAWSTRGASIAAASKSLDDAMAKLGERDLAATAAEIATEKKLASITIPGADRDLFADRMKGVVAKKKMRLANMSAMKRDPTGKPAVSIRYDFEIQGDYRAVTKAVTALYDQPRALQLDRLEVNITDNYKKWSIVRAQGWVYETPAKEPIVAASSSPVDALFNDAIAEAGAPAACEGVSPPANAAEVMSKRDTLAARRPELLKIEAVGAREAGIARRKALVDEIVRRRDDNRAAFLSRTDELVRRSLAAVGLLAELRFKANGEPDWR